MIAPVIDYLINYLGCLIGIIPYIIMYQVVANKKYKFNIKNITITLLQTEFLLLMSAVNNLSFVLIGFVIQVILHKLIYKDNFLKLYSIAGIFYVITIVLAVIFGSILGYLTKYIQNDLYIKLIPQLATILMSISVILLINIKKIRNGLRSFFDAFGESISDMIFVSIIICFASEIISNAMLFADSFSQTLIIISFGLIIVFMILNSVYIKGERELLNLKNQELNNKNALYNVMIDDYRELKHNMINNLIIIQSKANHKGKKLIDNIINQSYKEQDRYINEIETAPDGFKDIIYTKLSAIKDEDITFMIENKVKKDVIKNLKPRKYCAVCEALAIGLDNAIEAVTTSFEKTIHLYFEEVGKTLTIHIINNFCNDIDADLLGSKNYSTKNRNSGLGLNHIMKNKNLKTKTTIVNNKFILTIELDRD